MKTRSAKFVPTLTPLSARLVLSLLTLLVGVFLSQAVLAATDSIVDCDRLESSLRSLEVSTDELNTEQEDLATPGASANTVPVLLLTPRASSITREVFDALPIVVIDADGEELDAPQSPVADVTKTAAGTSPISDSSTMPDSGKVLPSNDAADNPRFLHRFQRQMYRTDI